MTGLQRCTCTVAAACLLLPDIEKLVLSTPDEREYLITRSHAIVQPVVRKLIAADGRMAGSFL